MIKMETSMEMIIWQLKIKIKKALKENVKAIISKILTETTINEAATAKLSDWGAGYESFEGVKPVVNELKYRNRA